MAAEFTNLMFTADICAQMSPTHIQFAAALKGIEAPDPEQPFRYCQIACGFGVTLLPLAANYPDGQFLGTDPDAAQVEYGNRLAREAGLSNLSFRAVDPGDLVAEGGEPFDFIALHGVWSSTDAAMRHRILDLLDVRLREGGAAYLSYKTLPGKAPLDAIYRLLIDLTPAGLTPLERVEMGKTLLRELLADPTAMTAAMPVQTRLIQEILDEEDCYVALEYFEAGWQAFYSADIIGAMATEGLGFVSSTLQPQMFDEETVPPAHWPRYQSLSTDAERQLFRDVILNANFRRDLFIKQPPHGDPAGRVRLAPSPFTGAYKSTVRLPAGPLELPEASADLFYAASVSPSRLVDLRPSGLALRRLIMSRQLVAVRPESAVAAAAKSVGAYNRRAVALAERNGEAPWIATPLTGGAVERPAAELASDAAELARLGTVFA